MVNDVRNYSSTTREMSLLSAADVGAESVALDSLQGLPDPPFTLILSSGTSSEEVVLATEVSGSNVSIVRAQAGTTAKTHRSEEHTSELQSRENLVCRLLLEKKNHIT